MKDPGITDEGDATSEFSSEVDRTDSGANNAPSQDLEDGELEEAAGAWAGSNGDLMGNGSVGESLTFC